MMMLRVWLWCGCGGCCVRWVWMCGCLMVDFVDGRLLGLRL